MAVDASALERRLREMALEQCGRLADGVVDGLQRRVRRRTGKIHDSISHDEPVDAGDRMTCHVTVADEAGLYEDEGTGVYGPDGVRIKGNPLLAFDWPAAGGLVIVHSVAGSPGSHFWSETMNDWPNIVRAVA